MKPTRKQAKLKAIRPNGRLVYDYGLDEVMKPTRKRVKRVVLGDGLLEHLGYTVGIKPESKRHDWALNLSLLAGVRHKGKRGRLVFEVTE